MDILLPSLLSNIFTLMVPSLHEKRNVSASEFTLALLGEQAASDRTIHAKMINLITVFQVYLFGGLALTKTKKAAQRQP